MITQINALNCFHFLRILNKESNFKWILWRQKLILLEKITVSDEHMFLNKGKLKFLETKNDTTKQKCCQKHEKRYCK